MEFQKVLHRAFHVICVFATTGMVGFWIYKFELDKDITSMNYKQYFDTKDDTIPVISICFSDPFLEEKLTQHKVNVSTYKSFLFGEMFEERLMGIDYDSVTINLKYYLREYYVILRNESRLRYSKEETVGWKVPYVSFNGMWYDRVLKCFALEITDKSVMGINFEMNLDIFQNSVRPSIGKFFVFLHLKNQMLRSLNTLKWQWPKRLDDTSFVMDFWIRDAEIMVRRNKKSEPCIPEWQTYDNLVIREHLNNISCIAPYQGYISHDFPICNTKENMKMAKWSLTDGRIYNYPPPCRSLKKITYDYEEYHPANETNGSYGWFAITPVLFDLYYKEIVLSQVISQFYTSELKSYAMVIYNSEDYL